MQKKVYQTRSILSWRYSRLFSFLIVIAFSALMFEGWAQSGVPWKSGGSNNTNLQSSTYQWGTFRGKTCNFQVVYSTRNAGWGSFVATHGPSGQIANFTDASIEILIQTSPFPEGNTYSALIAGSYDSYWQQIGTHIKNRVESGKPTIISIAWEMNGTYMFWGGGPGASHYSSPAQYIAGYRRIVDQLRVTYPQVRTAWIINAHATPAAVGTTNAWDLYPGNAYVTYVGTDDYDHYPPAPTKTAFDSRASANGGMYWLATQAAANGKQIIVGEWGVAPGSGANGTGDNANYIQWMYETFLSWYGTGRIYGEYYFADPCGGGNVDSDLINCNPNARARYIQYWSSSGSGDTQAPTVPTGLASSNITQNSFTLTWNASTDNVAVTGYEVFRNGVSVGTPSTTSFNVTGLSCNTAYSMTVRARDAVPNWSAQSSALNVTTSTCSGGGTPDDEFTSTSLDGKWSWVREVPANWSLTAAPGNMRITLEPGDLNHTPADNKNLLIQNAPSGDWSIITKVNCKPNANWKQVGVIVYQDDQNYLKMVRLYNNAQQFQFAKEVGGVFSTGLTADAIVSTISQLKITKIGSNYSGYYSADGNSWTQVWTTQAQTMSNIKIGILAANGGSTGTQISDFDFFHYINEGAPDTQAPSVPTGLASSAIGQTSFTLTWTASTDNVGVTGYEVFRNGVSIGTPSTTSFNVTGLTCNTSYSMTVRARDAVPNWSAQSTALNVTTSACPDTQAPSVPTGLASSNLAQTSFTLTWTASTDNVGVTGYEVFRNGVSIGTPSTTSFNVTGLTCNTTYSMTVRARDAVPNWSAQSSALNVTTSACSGNPADDEFNVSTLDPKWSWVRQNPANWSLTAAPGNMRIILEPGDLNHNPADNKNLLIQNAPSGDWTIITKVDCKPNANWKQVGVIVYQDDQNYLKMVRLYNNAQQFQFAKEVGGVWSTGLVADAIVSTISQLRISKVGNNYSGYYSADGTAWTQVWTTQAQSMSNIKIGILSANGAAAGTQNSDFDFFHLTTGGGGGRIGAPAPESKELTEVEESVDFLAYPNPTTGFVELALPVDFKDEADIRVINSSGGSVLDQTVKGRTVTLDLNHVSTGLYVIKASNGKRTVLRKILRK